MSFELLTPTAAKLTSVTPRTETHGEDHVFAISLGLRITGANTLLDDLSPTLRATLYQAVKNQESLPGVEESTPLLRTKGIDTVVLSGALEGWTLTVDHGIDEGARITLGACKVDKFRVAPREGGTVDLSFRIGSNDIDAHEAGLLCSKLSQEISLTLRAPKKTEPAIDGSTAAFAADHSNVEDLFAASDEAEDDNDAASIEGNSVADAIGPLHTGVSSRTARGKARTSAALDSGSLS